MFKKNNHKSNQSDQNWHKGKGKNKEAQKTQ